MTPTTPRITATQVAAARTAAARGRRANMLTWRAFVVMAAMTALPLGFVLWARATDFGVLRAPPATAVETRVIRFEDQADGGLAIYDAKATRPFQVIGSDGPSFIRGTMRALKHGRRINHAPESLPFELIRWSDGRFSLRDPVDGREIALEAFGPTNAAEFRRLLAMQGVP